MPLSFFKILSLAHTQWKISNKVITKDHTTQHLKHVGMSANMLEKK